MSKCQLPRHSYKRTRLTGVGCGGVVQHQVFKVGETRQSGSNLFPKSKVREYK